MDSSGKTIAKNISVMMASQIITWGLSFAVAIFLPRYLGASAIGEIAIANSIWMIMGSLVTFGMDLHLTKVVARTPAKAAELMGTSLGIRLIFFVGACAVVALYLYGLSYDIRTVYVTYIIGVSYFFGSLSGAINAVLTGLERLEYVSLTGIISKMVSTGLSLLVVFLGFGLYMIAAVNPVTAIVSLLLLAYFVSRQYQLRIRFNMADARAMIRQSFPYLLTGIALVVYQEIDKLFISSLVDTRTVGWYSTAMTLYGTLMFIPTVLVTVLFPVLARAHVAAGDQFVQMTRRSFDLMFLTSVPLGLGVSLIARPLMLLIYGQEFVQSGAILALLGVVLIFAYLNILLGQLLISTDRTNRLNLVMLIAIGVTIPMDLVLVPWTHNTLGNGALGGALTFLITEFAMVTSSILFMPKNTLQWSNVRTAALSLLSGLTMMAASWWCRETMMPLAILIGAVTYIGMVFLLRIVPREDLLLAREIGAQALGRLRGRKESPARAG
jgi:O-antigen/teichoic acid export membrane protein